MSSFSIAHLSSFVLSLTGWEYLKEDTCVKCDYCNRKWSLEPHLTTNEAPSTVNPISQHQRWCAWRADKGGWESRAQQLKELRESRNCRSSRSSVQSVTQVSWSSSKSQQCSSIWLPLLVYRRPHWRKTWERCASCSMGHCKTLLAPDFLFILIRNGSNKMRLWRKPSSFRVNNKFFQKLSLEFLHVLRLFLVTETEDTQGKKRQLERRHCIFFPLNASELLVLTVSINIIIYTLISCKMFCRSLSS